MGIDSPAETTVSLDPLKDLNLGCLLDVEKKGGERAYAQESYSEEEILWGNFKRT